MVSYKALNTTTVPFVGMFPRNSDTSSYNQDEPLFLSFENL